MSVPHSEILKAFRQRWLASSMLAALVPGGLHQGNVPDDSRQPYASLKVRHEQPEYNSGTSYVQKFKVDLTVWSSAGPADAGKIEQTIQGVYPRSVASLLTLKSGTVLQVQQAEGDLDVEPEMKSGKDVLITALAWELLIQGSN